MDIQIKKETAATVVTITGRLDAVTAPEYESKIKAVIAGGAVLLAVDFEKLNYISSAGLRALLVTAKLRNTRLPG